MITKKAQIEGASLELSLSPLQAIRDYFGAEEYQPQPIAMHSAEYRTFRKKIVSEGRLEKWGAVATGIEKERMSIERIRERRKREGW